MGPALPSLRTSTALDRPLDGAAVSCLLELTDFQGKSPHGRLFAALALVVLSAAHVGIQYIRTAVLEYWGGGGGLADVRPENHTIYVVPVLVLGTLARLGLVWVLAVFFFGSRVAVGAVEVVVRAGEDGWGPNDWGA